MPREVKDSQAGARDTTTQREKTPGKPCPQGEPLGQGTPSGNKKSAGEGKQLDGTTPPPQGKEQVAHAPDARESWGYLPEHARDVFRTQGGGQMPARYREWIDAYYRKLNQKP